MAVIAAKRALASSGRDVSEIDTVIGASSSDNDAFPTIAGWVQMRLGLPPIRATMLRGACACQTEAFQVCAEVLASGSAKLVLLVTSEGLLPNIMNVLDWKTSSLFGEGAAAFLLERSDEDTYLINGSDAHQAQSLPGGWGVVADDAIAGATSLLALQALLLAQAKLGWAVL